MKSHLYITAVTVACHIARIFTSFFTGLIDDVRIYDQALSAENIEALAR